MSTYTQVAALPFIILGDELSICLITSRETGRWVIPKGWPKLGIKNYQMAQLEAEQEAGLRGTIAQTHLGTYTYKKKLHIFASVICKVEVYPLSVTHQDVNWPERNQRELSWTSIPQAIKRVSEPQFSQLLTKINKNNRQQLTINTINEL